MVVSRWILWHSSHQEMGCILSPFIESNVPVTALTNRVITQSLSHAQLFATLWTAALQALLSSTIPWVCSNSCPLSWWRQPTISSYVIPFSSHLQSFPASGSFPMSQFFTLGGQGIGIFSFSISPSNEYSGLISFRMDWFDLPAIQGTLKSFLQHQSSKTSILWHSSFFYSPTLTSIHDHWKNHSLD